MAPILLPCLALHAPLRALGALPRTGPTYGQQVVAAVLMAEAWSEGEVGMLAVADVIRARAEATHRSPLAVVQKPFQFTCLNRIPPEELIRRYQHQDDFDVALRISRRLYNAPQTIPRLARGATHFTRAGTVAHWTQGQRPVVRIGRLEFYRLHSGTSGR